MSAASLRSTVNDFMRDIRACGVNAGTSNNLYGASLNSDNTTVQVTKNGVVLYAKVLWQFSGAGKTDASGPNFDSVQIFDGTGVVAIGGAQNFLQSLV